jgi:hypothetical protein
MRRLVCVGCASLSLSASVLTAPALGASTFGQNLFGPTTTYWAVRGVTSKYFPSFIGIDFSAPQNANATIVSIKDIAVPGVALPTPVNEVLSHAPLGAGLTLIGNWKPLAERTKGVSILGPSGAGVFHLESANTLQLLFSTPHLGRTYAIGAVVITYKQAGVLRTESFSLANDPFDVCVTGVSIPKNTPACTASMALAYARVQGTTSVKTTTLAQVAALKITNYADYYAWETLKSPDLSLTSSVAQQLFPGTKGLGIDRVSASWAWRKIVEPLALPQKPDIVGHKIRVEKLHFYFSSSSSAPQACVEQGTYFLAGGQTDVGPARSVSCS